MDEPIRFGIVGTGWRSKFYLRIAAACPERFSVAGIVGRNREKGSDLAATFGVDCCGGIDELTRKGDLSFVVSSVDWDSNPAVIKELASRGVPVLSETPPARSIADMDELCALARHGAKVQVAEQYVMQPHHAARLAVARSGKLGTVSQAQVSAAHGYHGISLIRRFLGVSYENVTVTASRFISPILKTGGRDGGPEREEVVDSEQLLAFLDFGDRLGVFDFTEDQYFGETRNTRILVRGERGEMTEDAAVYLKDWRTPIHAPLVRHQAGEGGNLQGVHLKGIQFEDKWVYRNPLAPARLFDDEIAVGSCLVAMAEYLRGGPEFYSLAEACQDRYLDMLIRESAEAGKPVSSRTQSWAG